MSRKISQQDLDSEIRSYLVGAGAAEPPSLGDVLDRLPDRAGAGLRSFPAVPSFPGVMRFAGVAVILILAAAAVGVPLMMSKPGPAAVGQTNSPAANVTSGTFAPTGSMTTPRQGATAVRLLDGKVLIAGGWSDPQTPLASAELYDPATGKFGPTGSMSTTRSESTVTLLRDGRVLFAGGTDATGLLASAEIYDPTTGRFSPTGSMTLARASQSATLLPDGHVLIAGGEGDGVAVALASAELYDPATGKFSPTGAMVDGRMFQSATLLSNGKVLTAGGYALSRILPASVVTAPTLGPSDKVLFASILTSAELYDPATGKFSPTGSMATARDSVTTTLLSDGRVLIVGDYAQSEQPTTSSPGPAEYASAELYDPATGKFILTGSMASPRSLHAAVLLSDGRVLVVGGGTQVANLATAELYSPKTGTFSPTGSMSVGRSGPIVIRLPDGRVLVAGGIGDGDKPLSSAEVYQP
jgi:hypothetical protein